MTWSSIDLASQCLADLKRTNQIVDAIREIVGAQDRVIDIGTGTGVLAIAAAKQTRGEVHAIEADPDVVEFLVRRKNSLPKNLSISAADANKFCSEKFYDVAIIELIDTWLLCEDLAPVLHSLYTRGAISRQTRIVPLSYSFHIEFGRSDFQWGEGHFDFPYYEWPFYKGTGWKVPRFDPMLHFIDIEQLLMVEVASKKIPGISKLLRPERTTDDLGISVNAVRLSGTVCLTPSNKLTYSNALNAPVVLPLRKDFLLGPNDSIKIEAEFSKGFRSLRIFSDAEQMY